MHRENYYTIEEIKEEFTELRKFCACKELGVCYKSFFEKIISSVQWLLSFEYVELRGKKEIDSCKNDKQIFKMLVKYGAKNCEVAYEYMKSVLYYLKSQPITEIMQAELRVRMVNVFKDMIPDNETLYFISGREKKKLAEFCLELLDEAEAYLIKSDIKFQKKKLWIEDMKMFHSFMEDSNYFRGSLYKNVWCQKSIEKVQHYERILENEK